MSVSNPNLAPLKPLMIKERSSIIFVDKAEVDVIDGAFVMVDRNGPKPIFTHVPVGGIACIMLEPGTRLSHAAATLAARVGTLLVWVGEGAVRVYSSGQPGGARSDRLLYQAQLALDESCRLRVVRKLYAMRFGSEPPARRSIEQLRGIEGARVRTSYQLLAKKYGVRWVGRNYDPEDWDASDIVNRCLSAATACLYGVTEAAVLAAGYAPAIGFIHTGKPLSFVYDVADIYKFETVVPAAFQVAATNPPLADQAVRYACRDLFRKTRILDRIIPDIEEILAAGQLALPAKEFVAPAIPNPPSIGDAGHRS